MLGLRQTLDDTELILEETDLKRKSVNNGVVSLIGQLSNFGITMISTIILARILTPEDYGLVAIITAIYTFFLLLNDFGFSLSLTRKKKLTNDEISTMTWLNNLIAISFSIIMFGSSFIIAAFYDDSRLMDITQVFSIIFILGGISSFHNVILIRQMKFNLLVFANILSIIIGVTIAIIMAIQGHGYWAIVANLLFTAFAKSILLITFLQWYPPFLVRKNHIVDNFHFGKNITLFNFVNYFSRNLDNFIIGKYYGMSTLGYYTKAYQLLMLPVQQIRGPIYNVAMPALSALKNNPIAYNNYFINLSSILNLLTIPIVSFMWLNSKDIILLLLGEQWEFTIVLFSILAFSALVQPILGMLGLVLITLDQSERYFNWGLLNFFIIGSGFVLGLFYDVMTFAIIYVVANYISFIVSIPFTLNRTHIDKTSFIKVFIIPFIYFVPMVLIIKYYFPTNINTEINLLIIKNIVFLIYFFFFFVIFPEYKSKIIKIKEILKGRK